MEKTVSVPSVSGLKGAATDYAVGGIGGLIFAITSGMFGSGFIGSLLAAMMAGSVVKGNRGQTLATMAGYTGIASLVSGGGNGGNADDTGVM